MRSLILNNIFNYLSGVVLALCGKYPHKELEHLDYLTVQLTTDYQWLSSTKYRRLAERHFKMIQPGYRSKDFKSVQQIRDDIEEKGDCNGTW